MKQVLKQPVKIEVCYALPGEQKIITLEIEQGTSALKAVVESGIQLHFPEIDLDNLKLAIYSTLIETDYVVNNGDRIEILRPLLADPKEVRKRRAAEMKAKKEAQKLERSSKTA